MGWLVLWVILFSGIHPAWAADIRTEGKVIYLDGEITKGDAEIFRAKWRDQRTTRVVRINSKGGDLKTALDIASIVKKNHIGVVANHNGYCASSCFFIFMSGYDRTGEPANDDGTLPSRDVANRFGYVGIHRPYFSKSTSAREQEQMMVKVRQILAEARVPQHLIDTMMARPSNEIYWLSMRDLEMLGEINPGDEEVLIQRCGYKRVMKRVKEKASRDEMQRMVNCSEDYWSEIYDVEQDKNKMKALNEEWERLLTEERKLRKSK